MPEVEAIQQLLDQLTSYESTRNSLVERMESEKDGVITGVQKARIAAIEADYSGQLSTLAEKIAELTNEVKKAVIEHGESVRGYWRHAVFTPSRPVVKWNSDGLDGYAIAHPEILRFRTEEPSKPSVTIREIKRMDK